MENIKILDASFDCDNVKYFPVNKDLVGPPPDQKLIDSIGTKGQLQQVGLLLHNKKYYFAWGKRRLKAIRILKEAGKASGEVRVAVVQGISPDQIAVLTLIENSVRSANEIDTYLNLVELLKHYKGGDLSQAYKDIRVLTGHTKNEIIAIEKRWCKVPLWVLNAVRDDKITAATAKEIGRVSPDQQLLCKEQLKTGKLTTAFVQDLHRLTQTQVYATVIAGMPGVFQKQPRQRFVRQELELVWNYLNQNMYVEAHQALEELMNQME